ncbi:sulfotransferase domain-containing protein [Microcoleus sp. A2-C5]|uniref:sulfotransferase domain-containing protein n=1 Tax=unclassified Microcoleus TaxID=2642155 RepID=UPI002FD10D7A
MLNYNIFKPTFIIIGERKCGTSSLYRYLISHPNVLPCQLKEPQFFSKPESFVLTHFPEYLKLFPSIDFQGDISFEWPELNEVGIVYFENVQIKREEGKQYITGEASANYLCEANPHLLKRLLPDIKLIVILRNPTERAYSHYQMFVRFQAEGRNLGFNIRTFAEEVRDEIQKIREGGRGEFVFPGMYINQISQWTKVFGKDRILILHNESLKKPENAQKIMDKIGLFLELSSYNYGTILSKKFNLALKEEPSKKVAQMLSEFYQPYNQALELFLDRKFNWDV